ncbi:NUDIX domain-containing protein [Propionimicrobium sp. PCR01-08-3]|uniref:NUDIX hydrolase n=1 Tax=Propionimicrobium sp. PCR01-08-3 TaxID=3052086 RepID=UPI00255CDE8E|nr:NUDIX domain-containing protein [Propionimicrobium sp. PCR01-08-3]WIY82868.1 NUDIX domain-containing protein [Propionimicrobium sp. PCR01-08-3]
MNDPDRRPMVAVPPRERRVRTRQAARVVVRAEGRVLLGSDTDPGMPGTQWWVTPGGGLDAGETFAEGAARELAEETGLVVDPGDLTGPIARRVVHHGYSDHILQQREDFFVLDLPARFEPDTAGFTEDEKVTMAAGFGWFTLDELTGKTVWPVEIARLMRAEPGDELIDFGDVEESTVPVSLGHR